MVSDSELVKRLREVLRESDLDTTTPSSLRRQLEEHFGVDLSDRKPFIRDQIDFFLNSLPHQDDYVNESETGIENDAVEEQDAEKEVDDDVDEEDEETERSNKAEVKKRGGGFNKLCSLSPRLQVFLGVTELARTEVVKRLWAYIREKSLQDPKNKRNIMCDEALHALFGVKTINMFQMNKALSKHIWPLNPEDGTGKQRLESERSDDSVSEERNAEEEELEEEKKEQSKKGRSKKVDKDVKKRSGGGGGFNKLCSLSPQLQDFVGVPELARTEVVKKLWAYIRENNLQDPSNKRKILCDESLRTIFNVDSIDMFQMNKALSKHIWPLNGEEGRADSSSHKEVQHKRGREEGSDEPKQKEKQQKQGASGILAPLQLSDALVKFLGTGESTLSRADAVKRMWQYIKQNDLQDPSDKRRILCDDKLKELFQVESFNGFSVSKLLNAHFIKMEQ